MNNDLELLNESFKSLDQDELNSIDGGFDWRDVAMAGGAMLGGALTGGSIQGTWGNADPCRRRGRPEKGTVQRQDQGHSGGIPAGGAAVGAAGAGAV